MSIEYANKNLTGLCLILLALFAAQVSKTHSLVWVPPPPDLAHSGDTVKKTAENSSKSARNAYQILGFGFTPAVVDLLWIKALQDDALFHVKRDQHTETFYLLRSILGLDPGNFAAYYFAANFLAIIRDDVHGALSCLEMAQDFRKSSLSTYPASFKKSYWLQEWLIPFYMAYIHWAELSDLPSSAPLFAEASAIEGAPSYLKVLGEKLRTTDGQYIQALFMLRSFYDNSEPGKEKDRYKAQWDDLSIGYDLFKLNGEFKVYAKSRIANATVLEKFLTERRLKAYDARGGALYLDAKGLIRSKTERKYTFGLEF